MKVPIHDPCSRRRQSGSETLQVGKDPHYSSWGNHMFPYGLDYIFTLFFIRCWALIWYYEPRLVHPVVSEPSTEVSSVAWLLIALSYKRFRVPAIHPIYSDPILVKPLIKTHCLPNGIKMQSDAI